METYIYFVIAICCAFVIMLIAIGNDNKRQKEAADLKNQYLALDLEGTWDKKFNKFRQLQEDNKVASGIRQEAMRLFREWMNTPEVELNGGKFRPYLVVISPFIHAYTIHDEDSAQYKDCRINDLVMEQFNKFKEEFNNI